MSGSLADYRVDIEHVSTGRRADSITTRAASEDEARRKAEDEIRHSPTPHDLRVATVTNLASATPAGEATMSASAEVLRLYNTDIVAWAEHQALALRRRAANEIDWENVAEEIQDLAARQRDQIESRLSVLCEHLLKWQFQPEIRSGSWRGSVVEARDRIARIIQKNPSLKDYPAAVLSDAYPPGKRKAEAETGLTNLPETCPWTIEQALDLAFWP
jgi:hypothetical protein